MLILLSFAVCVQFICCEIFLLDLGFNFAFIHSVESTFLCRVSFAFICSVRFIFWRCACFYCRSASIFHWKCWFDFIRSICDLVCSDIFCYCVFFFFCKGVPNGPPYVLERFLHVRCSLGDYFTQIPAFLVAIKHRFNV